MTAGFIFIGDAIFLLFHFHSHPDFFLKINSDLCRKKFSNTSPTCRTCKTCLVFVLSYTIHHILNCYCEERQLTLWFLNHLYLFPRQLFLLPMSYLILRQCILCEWERIRGATVKYGELCPLHISRSDASIVHWVIIWSWKYINSAEWLPVSFS